MENSTLTPDQLIRNLVSSTRDIIQCAECRGLTQDAVRAGCAHIYCRKCLYHKFQNFDTEENFAYCSICKTQLPKANSTSLTPKVARLNILLKQCVQDFCDDAALDMRNYLGSEVRAPPRTYSKKQPKPPGNATEVTPKLGAKEKVEQWLITSTDSLTTNKEQSLTPNNENVSTESFVCSSTVQRSLPSKESYEILPAPSPPPNNEPANPKKGRGRGGGRGRRKSALPINSGDRSGARRRGRSAGSTLDETIDLSLNGGLSTSPASDLTRERAATSTPLPNLTPLTGPKRRGRPPKRSQSTFSDISRQSDGNATGGFPNETVIILDEASCPQDRTGEQMKEKLEEQVKEATKVEADEQLEIMEVDFFDPSSPAHEQTCNEITSNEETAHYQSRPPATSEKPDTLAVLIEEILPDIQMVLDNNPVEKPKQAIERVDEPSPQITEDVLPRTPTSASVNQKHFPGEQASLRFIRIASPSRVDIDKSQHELNKENLNSLNASKELNHSKIQNKLSTVITPKSTSALSAHSIPSQKLSNRNRSIPSIIVTNELDNTETFHEGEIQKIVDYSSSSASASVSKKRVSSLENPEPVERMKINFIHKSRLVPKQKVVIVHKRKVIPFVKKGKFDSRYTQQTIESHQCPAIETKICLTKENQTESVISSDAIVQTDEPEVPTVIKRSEMEVQTDQELWNSFLKEMSGVFPMEATRDPGNETQRSRDPTPDVFCSAEPFKRARVLSGGCDDGSEPKRKRMSFDIEPTVQAEFQAPMPSASRAASIEEASGKTVIMESDQESDSVDIVAPTPPRKQPVPKRVFTCSGVKRSDVKVVQLWARGIGAEVVPTYTPAVTHVIVQVDANNCAQRTLKFLYGIAHSKWIVSLEWVESSMREGCVVDEELFEALDMEGESGPHRSRMKNTASSKLFQAFEFCCQEPFTDVTVNELSELLRLCGAATPPSPAQIEKSRRLALIVVQVDEANETEVQRRAASWLGRYKVLSVSREWVLDCLASYKLLPIRSHLIGKHSEAFLKMMRFDGLLLG